MRASPRLSPFFVSFTQSTKKFGSRQPWWNMEFQARVCLIQMYKKVIFFIYFFAGIFADLILIPRLLNVSFTVSATVRYSPEELEFEWKKATFFLKNAIKKHSNNIFWETSLCPVVL